MIHKREYFRLRIEFHKNGFHEFFKTDCYPSDWIEWLRKVAFIGNMMHNEEEFLLRGLHIASMMANLFVPGFVCVYEVFQLRNKCQRRLAEKNRGTPGSQQVAIAKHVSGRRLLPQVPYSPEVLDKQHDIDRAKKQLAHSRVGMDNRINKIQNIRDQQIPEIRSLMAQLYGTVQPMDSTIVSGTHDKAVSKLQTFLRLTKNMPLYHTAELVMAACELGRIFAEKRLAFAIEATFLPLPAPTGIMPIQQFFLSFVRVNLDTFIAHALGQLPQPVATQFDLINMNIPLAKDSELTLTDLCIDTLKTQLGKIKRSIDQCAQKEKATVMLGKVVEDYMRVGFQIAVAQQKLMLSKDVLSNDLFEVSYTRDSRYENVDKIQVDEHLLNATNFVVIPGLVTEESESKCFAKALILDGPK
ncbi:hypothetical protein HK100_000607 [Physocladia obscura]|uniref:Uncharacterized protein n=1 Tax=Physocladia obscura TaxID=109957 RepID=A0AAD5XGU4_9FUNG|nr:hypothetical protein HK100_000607 [Physocladia obscura]